MQEQCSNPIKTSDKLIKAADNNPYFIQKVITGDKTWCFLYYPQIKVSSM